jgi:hypothetical protein
MGHTGRMNGVRWFIRREDDEPRRTPADSPFRAFRVCCLKCDSYLLRTSSEFDEESGEMWLWLICTRCGQRERVAVR